MSNVWTNSSSYQVRLLIGSWFLHSTFKKLFNIWVVKPPSHTALLHKNNNKLLLHIYRYSNNFLLLFQNVINKICSSKNTFKPLRFLLETRTWKTNNILNSHRTVLTLAPFTDFVSNKKTNPVPAQRENHLLHLPYLFSGESFIFELYYITTLWGTYKICMWLSVVCTSFWVSQGGTGPPLERVCGPDFPNQTCTHTGKHSWVKDARRRGIYQHKNRPLNIKPLNLTRWPDLFLMICFTWNQPWVESMLLKCLGCCFFEITMKENTKYPQIQWVLKSMGTWCR